MKTKIFIHKLLAMGTVAALGLCMGGTALAGAKTYSSNEITFLIQPKDAADNNITLESLDFFAVPLNNTNALKSPLIKGLDNVLISGAPFLTAADLTDAMAAPLNSETCVGILAQGANNNCKNTKPNTFDQQTIGIGNDFCRGKANIPFIPVLDDPNLPVSGGAQANAITECQFDRDNDGSGSADIQFAASIEVIEDGTYLLFGLQANPFLEAFCHEDPLFMPNATASMSFTISVVDDSNDAQVFAFNPDGILNPAAGQFVNEATLNTNRFCEEMGTTSIYDPFNPPVAGVNDCTLGDDATLCEYSARTPPLPAGKYNVVVAMSHDSNAQKMSVDIPPPVGDHFLCYKSFGSFLREEVNLVDQFDTDEGINFDVLKPKMFCNPAIKPELDSEAMLESGPHYLSYKINEAHREPRHERKMVEVENQFGTMTVETFKPDRLMVPSGKSLDLAVPPAIPAPGPKTNHYKCYTVKATGFQSPGDVAVLDQFTDDDGKKLGIVRPTRLCNPVEKTRSDGVITPIIEDPNNEFDHLMCYSVRPGAGEKLHKKTKVLSNNQFREEELVLKRELEFCVPTKKTLLEP